ncbi:hypothetical protein CU633_19405 [Bacillus sp. V3-13]|uniref:hypothetical protein n=1 Tax=Bacillus sp. V3-13 TaxID=2053728 RepID=UPI000C780DB7|nr:hypothetical protein [Bacillus sp. V3-13]PLR75732.1 hypothetical protein CU633_19405 [Bacillus sp. V3-13]
MENVIIYYQQKRNESTENAIIFIDSLIKNIKTRYNIKGVYIDNFENQNELLELLQSPLADIDYIYLDELPHDEFNWKLINQLARSEGFTIKFFSDI